MSIRDYISKASKHSFGRASEEIVTKINPECRSSKALTERNSTFGGNHEKAREFEERMIVLLDNDKEHYECVVPPDVQISYGLFDPRHTDKSHPLPGDHSGLTYDYWG